MDETKDLQVHSIIGSCTVTVSEKDTLSDVRAIILERYREDILPPDSSDFIIFVGDKQAPIWRFKEERTNAWNVINNSKWGFITLKVFGDKNKRNSSSSGNESDDDEQPLQKKSKTVETSINSSSYSSQKPGSSENGSEETEAENHDMDMNNQKMPPQESKTHIMPLTKPAKVFSHVTYDKAISESTTVLEDLNKILHDTRNTMFCSEDHRKELSEEMKTLLNTNSHPDVIIGCLGATGVG